MLVAELGDITRFDNPRQLMAYLGLVPSEHSSGATRRQPARFPRIRTRDTSAAPRRPMRAEVGSEALAAADPDALRQALAGLVEEAEVEMCATETDGRANSTAELAHTVRQLRAELARAQARLSTLERERVRSSLRLV